MRVLLVSKGLDIGGLERIVADLAVGLGKEGVETEVAVLADRRDQLVPLIEQAGVRVHRLGGTDHMGWRATWRLAGLVRAKRFDLVHVHGPLPAIAVRLSPGHRPIVTTSHTTWAGLRLLTRAGWRFTAHRDAAVIVVSSAVGASLPSRLGRRAVVIPHGVDPRAIDLARAATPRMGPQTRGIVNVVAVASHTDVKNYPNLLHAFRVARERGAPVRLVAIGDGPARAAHEQLAAELSVLDLVTFLPATLDVLPHIAAADLLVVASDFEGQPLVVAEALALGTPVVATNVGRVAELVSPSNGRIVPPGDAAALGTAIAELASAEELRTQLAHAARQRSMAWTLDDALDAHADLYRRTLGGRDPVD
jgi:glycosyltransferase involved in cell wall biosynthesis